MNPEPVRNIVPIRSVQSTISTRPIEMCVLALMILEPQSATIAIAMLRDDDFLSCADAVKTIRPLIERSQCDHITAAAALLAVYRNETAVENVISAAMKEFTIQKADASRIEEYCGIIAAESTRRRAKKLTQDALQGLLDPKGNPGAILRNLTVQASEIELHTAKPKRVARDTELEEQIEDEISGARQDFGWHQNWPRMNGTKTFLPGSLIVLCGSTGAAKSLFITETFWKKNFDGFPSTIMMLEDPAEYHERRIWSQMAGRSGLMHDNYVRDHFEEARNLYQEFKPSLDILRKARVIQTPGQNEKPTVRWLLEWVKFELERGKKMLAIDPITNLAPSRNRFLDEEELIREIKPLLSRYQAVCVLVTHPRDDNLPPSKANLSGSKAFDKFVSGIFWLKAVWNRSEKMVGGMGMAQDYNKEMFVLKDRNAHFEYGQRIAFRFGYGSLCFEEVGIIKNEDDE